MCLLNKRVSFVFQISIYAFTIMQTKYFCLTKLNKSQTERIWLLSLVLGNGHRAITFQVLGLVVVGFGLFVSLNLN